MSFNQGPPPHLLQPSSGPRPAGNHVRASSAPGPIEGSTLGGAPPPSAPGYLSKPQTPRPGSGGAAHPPLGAQTPYGPPATGGGGYGHPPPPTQSRLPISPLAGPTPGSPMQGYRPPFPSGVTSNPGNPGDPLTSSPGGSPRPTPNMSPLPGQSPRQGGRIPKVPSANELMPPPFRGLGQYTHNTHVGPPPQGQLDTPPILSAASSSNSSRVPSPVPLTQFDNVEGQFPAGGGSPVPTQANGAVPASSAAPLPPAGQSSPAPPAGPGGYRPPGGPTAPGPAGLTQAPVAPGAPVTGAPVAGAPVAGAPVAGAPSMYRPPSGPPPSSMSGPPRPPPTAGPPGAAGPPPMQGMPGQPPLSGPPPMSGSSSGRPRGPPPAGNMGGPPPSGPPMGMAGSMSGPPMGGAGSMSGPPMGGPGPMTGPPMGGAGSMSGPPMGGPGSMSGPPMGGPGSMGGPPMGGPGSMGGPPMGGPGSMGSPPMGGPGSMGGAPMGPPPTQPHRPMGGPPPMSGPPRPGAPPLPGQPYMGPSGAGMGMGMAGPPPSRAAEFEGISSLNNHFGRLVAHDAAPELRTYNLLQEKCILPSTPVEAPRPKLPDSYRKVNCSSELFRCTLNSVPGTQQLLSKSRLPLGVIIHPFKDLSELPVIQSSVIVRCRSCRTYINPFVTFIDSRRWRCNLCFRANEVPEEFNFDPVSKTMGSPDRRPEVKNATMELVAPPEYMLRPPQPAVYLFLLDVSHYAISTGYLEVFCSTLLEELGHISGDSRTMVGFIAFNESLHYYHMPSNFSQPHQLTVTDIEDVFLPTPDGLLVNLKEAKELINQLLTSLPQMFADQKETASALGPALSAAIKLMSATGGRVSVFQATMPNRGTGSLQSREDPNARAGAPRSDLLNPALDFYKKTALEAAGQQIAIDLFFLSGPYVDIATVSGAAKHCGGCVYHYPSLHAQSNPAEVHRFETDLRRYLTRKIGFEAVMRVRCTKGLSIHTFHGNFFVRSTDLLSLPNVNPDAGFGMQVAIDDNLNESSTVSFQAALLYTTSKAERRIRVHTICLPVTSSVVEVLNGADQQAIVSLLSKMAVDRSAASSLSDAREAMVNSAVDALGVYRSTLTTPQRAAPVLAPYSLRLLPLYINGLLKMPAFNTGVSIKTDDRVFSMEQCKTYPLFRLMKLIHPDLYPVHQINPEDCLMLDNDTRVPRLPLLQLSSACVDRTGVYLLDRGDHMLLYVGGAVSVTVCEDLFNVTHFQGIEDGMTTLPECSSDLSELLGNFIQYLHDDRSNSASLTVIREDSRLRPSFFQHMIEDRVESATSYQEFLQHLAKQIK